MVLLSFHSKEKSSMQYLQLFPLPYVHVGLPSDTPEQSPVKLQLSKRALSKRKLSKLS